MTSLISSRGLILTAALLLSGCNMIVMNPSGDIAMQQSQLIVISTFLMLLVVIPVMVLTVWFAWRYRKANKSARYEPDWDHSTKLELVIWGIPLLIIIALGLLTWISTHTLDPYRKLSRIDAQRPIQVDTKPLTVEVVALDWKWLFIYPEYGIATVNQLAAPVDVPIRFKTTASRVMNSFFIPALAGQIYSMPGMETPLHAVINRVGEYEGFSANYSGEGFSDMRFKFYGMKAEDFEAWVKKVKQTRTKLDRSNYVQLEQPSRRDPVRHYGAVEADLYHAILNRCLEPGQICMDKMMAPDKHKNMHQH
jgi:cytochrome o ubiquinol oxidase subunit 2